MSRMFGSMDRYIFYFLPCFFSFLAFPIHESAPFTLEWLFVELGLFYMQEGMDKRGVGVKDFSTGDKTPYLASGFLSHPRSS